MNKLIPRISGYGDYTRVYAQTHVYKLGVCKGSQWVLFVATLMNIYMHEGGPCVCPLYGTIVDKLKLYEWVFVSPKVFRFKS